MIFFLPIFYGAFRMTLQLINYFIFSFFQIVMFLLFDGLTWFSFMLWLGEKEYNSSFPTQLKIGNYEGLCLSPFTDRGGEMNPLEAMDLTNVIQLDGGRGADGTRLPSTALMKPHKVTTVWKQSPWGIYCKSQSCCRC